MNMNLKLAFLPLLLLASCRQPAGVTRLDAAQTEALLARDSTVQLLDVRTPAELALSGSIPGAQHLDFQAPGFWQRLDSLDRGRPVVVYCAAGSRSARTTAELVQMGFSQVYDYTGGMQDWVKKGKPATFE